MKKTIISSSICFVIGIAIGIGGLYLWQSKSLSEFNNSVVITGDNDKIDHKKIKNKKEHIEITTVAKKPGSIKTIIKKSTFCPKIYKNSLTFIVYGGIFTNEAYVSYGLEYHRQIFSRFHFLTGLKVDTNTKVVKGFQGFIGAGLNY